SFALLTAWARVSARIETENDLPPRENLYSQPRPRCLKFPWDRPRGREERFVAKSTLRQADFSLRSLPEVSTEPRSGTTRTSLRRIQSRISPARKTSSPESSRRWGIRRDVGQLRPVRE